MMTRLSLDLWSTSFLQKRGEGLVDHVTSSDPRGIDRARERARERERERDGTQKVVPCSQVLLGWVLVYYVLQDAVYV